VNNERRMQLDLRTSVNRLTGMGYEVVNRNPLKLTRKGCPVGWIQYKSWLVETRESTATDPQGVDAGGCDA